jgi:anaerobic selenocysteine-containing dehydrogenase
MLTFGRALGSPEPIDLEDAKLVVLIGSHLGENVFTSQITEFATGLSRGAKLVAVDPRFSTAASKADWWLPIKPGTDIALLLAWMNVLIAEGLYDKEYVTPTRWAEGAAATWRRSPRVGRAGHHSLPTRSATARAMGAAKPPWSSTPAGTSPGTATTPSAPARWRS